MRVTVPAAADGDAVPGWTVGRVVGLARFSVKSTAGEALSSVVVDQRGLEHDREWAAYTPDGGIASGKTTRRFRKVDGLMTWRSTVGEEDVNGDRPTVLHGPAGETYLASEPAASEALSRAMGRPLRLRRETDVPHHDDCGVHLVTTSSVRRVHELSGDDLDVRRLRANVVLETEGDGFLEDAWVGRELAIGPDVLLRLGAAMPRCVMVDQPQSGVSVTRPILQTLGREHAVLLGIQAEVLHPGTISLGDEARVRPS